MPGFTLTAAVSIAAGLLLGAAATVGVTLVVSGGDGAPAQPEPVPVVMSTVVQYGDRCPTSFC
ncbi:MAG: DUF2613 family protein [Mycobacterium sp.]|nr:MAG: DUF2613 family protein [Mycobacterium sp.]